MTEGGPGSFKQKANRRPAIPENRPMRPR